MNQKRRNLIEFILIFTIIYFGSTILFRNIFPQQDEFSEPVTLKAVDATVKEGHHPLLKLTNTTDQDIVLPDRCPNPPVDIFFVTTDANGSDRYEQIEATDNAVPCEPVTVAKSLKTTTIDLASWKYSAFDALGTYEVRLTYTAGENEETISIRLSIHEAGAITRLFRTFVTEPLLNSLIFITSLLPHKNLGISIIILTILIKLALFFPTQHALEGQKKMQAMQPKLDELKKKFKDNPQRLQQETVKLWKTEKINPFQSCLPLLLQFPVLIGLFYVIRDGSVLELSRHLLYVPYQNLSWSFNAEFLGLNLLNPSWYIMPPLLVVLQFTQLKLSFALAKRKKEKQKVIDVKKDGKSKDKASAQEMQQKMMLYGLPIMIGVFAFQFPAAVSLYWAVSTTFAIGQQLVVNKRTETT